MISVTKQSGRLQKFSKAKIARGCRRAGCDARNAQLVANRIARQIYDKISTRRIGELVVANLRRVDRDSAVSFNRVFSRNWRRL